MTSIESKQKILMTIIILAFIAGFCLALVGSYLAYTGIVSETEFELFGQKFKSTNVGLAIVFIGAAIVILMLGRVLTSVDSSTPTDPRELTDKSNHLAASQELVDKSILVIIPKNLRSENLDFGLLHIRNGKDEVPGSGPLINSEIQLQPTDKNNQYHASVLVPRNIGFQYKLFVDYSGVDFERVKELLKDAGFTQISKGEGKPNRAWFIIPDKPVYTTVDGIVNNFFYPS